MRYSIDTSALLEAWRRHYPPDVMPALWTGMGGLIRKGELRATEEVLHELEQKDDEVHAWAKRQRDFFVDVDDDIQPIVSDILNQHAKLVDTRKNRSGADPFVIALAMQHNLAVVTNELKTGSAARPNIPDVCEALGVRCLPVLDLIREQGWVFHL